MTYWKCLNVLGFIMFVKLWQKISYRSKLKITEKIIEESDEKANKEEKLSENSDVMKTEIPSASDSQEPNVSTAKEESEETAEGRVWNYS